MIRVDYNGGDGVEKKAYAINVLFPLLEERTLDPMFEDYGNFIIKMPLGTIVFWGNFYGYSHIFRIETDETYLINKLTDAIRKNQDTMAYKDLKATKKNQAKLLELAQKDKETITTGLDDERSRRKSEEDIFNGLIKYLQKTHRKYKSVAEHVAWEIIYCNGLEKSR